jgi:hypothetical protein
MHQARTAAVAAFALAVALVLAANAAAAVRIEKTLTIRPAPHGGITPAGTLEPGQSVQEFHLKLPVRASDCSWSLTDPGTGRVPVDPFPGQPWKLMFAGVVHGRDWALILRVVNLNIEARPVTLPRWRLVLRCATPRHPPACSLQSFSVPDPADYLALGLHCRVAARRLHVTLPAGYGVRLLLAADNSLLHAAMDCRPSGPALTCDGRMPADTTTWLGFFVTKPLTPGLRVTAAVPRTPPARARTRRLDLRF